MSDPADGERLELVAYTVTPGVGMGIVPAGRWRDWMPPTSARLCLPILMANESAWWLLNPRAVRVSWDGGPGLPDVKVEFPDEVPSVPPVLSVFGHGIVTWQIPYLFRTPPGWNLLTRGPANLPRDGVAPLEGLVETDWAASPFTMNWQLTRPGTVEFAKGEPICQIIPQARQELERFDPRLATIGEEPEVAELHEAWARGRHELEIKKFLGQHVEHLAGYRGEWEQSYFRGRLPDGSPAPDHQTKVRLGEFAGNGDAPEAG